LTPTDGRLFVSVKVRDFKHDGRLWLVVHHEGKRNAFRARSDDQREAEKEAHELERRLEGGLGVGPDERGPSFGDISERYLNEATAELAETTRADRRTLLSYKGILGRYFDERPADEITRAVLLEWWGSEVVGRERSTKTGRNYLDALSGVFAHAVGLGFLHSNPVDELRLLLRRRNRTKGARAATAQPKPTPFEDPNELMVFCDASQELSDAGHLISLLMLDAGLRLGEAGGVSWEAFWWGRDLDDVTRSVRIEHTRPRGFRSSTPKSGFAREVSLSKRLRGLFREEWVKRGQPQGPIFPTFDPWNYRKRHFAKVCKRAGLGHRQPKDLRDSFASHLLSNGIQLGYVSEQLGHGNVAVTARHYARWVGGRRYQEPLVLRAGEVPADLLARLAEERGRALEGTASKRSDPVESRTV